MDTSGLVCRVLDIHADVFDKSLPEKVLGGKLAVLLAA